MRRTSKSLCLIEPYPWARVWIQLAAKIVENQDLTGKYLLLRAHKNIRLKYVQYGV